MGGISVPVTLPATIPAGEFKAKCLKLLDQVAADRRPLIVTKHGKPVAQIVPMPANEWVDPIGAMRGSGVIVGGIISPLENEWEVEK
jgi:prevent-host-death family protein